MLKNEKMDFLIKHEKAIWEKIETFFLTSVPDAEENIFFKEIIQIDHTGYWIGETPRSSLEQNVLRSQMDKNKIQNELKLSNDFLTKEQQENLLHAYQTSSIEAPLLIHAPRKNDAAIVVFIFLWLERFDVVVNEKNLEETQKNIIDEILMVIRNDFSSFKMTQEQIKSVFVWMKTNNDPSFYDLLLEASSLEDAENAAREIIAQNNKPTIIITNNISLEKSTDLLQFSQEPQKLSDSGNTTQPFEPEENAISRSTSTENLLQPASESPSPTSSQEKKSFLKVANRYLGNIFSSKKNTTENNKRQKLHSTETTDNEEGYLTPEGVTPMTQLSLHNSLSDEVEVLSQNLRSSMEIKLR